MTLIKIFIIKIIKIFKIHDLWKVTIHLSITHRIGASCDSRYLGSRCDKQHVVLFMLVTLKYCIKITLQPQSIGPDSPLSALLMTVFWKSVKLHSQKIGKTHQPTLPEGTSPHRWEVNTFVSPTPFMSTKSIAFN